MRARPVRQLHNARLAGDGSPYEHGELSRITRLRHRFSVKATIAMSTAERRTRVIDDVRLDTDLIVLILCAGSRTRTL